MDLPRILFFLFLSLALSCLPACDQEAVHNESYDEEDTRVEVVRDVEILYSDSAVVRIRITAPLMLNYTARERPRQEFPEGVRVDFLNATQQITSTLTSKNAVREQDKGEVVMRDSVQLVTAKREKLETEELIWNDRSELVRTEKFVKVTKPGEVMYGFGLEANQDFTYWKILVPKGRIKTEQIDQALGE